MTFLPTSRRYFKQIPRYILIRQCSANAKSFQDTAEVPRVMRKYVSRMDFGVTQEFKKNKLTCTSQQLFNYFGVAQQCHAGVHVYLPIGIRALEKLIRIIDEEMECIGAQKISMPSLVPARLWKKTGRWDTNELFKLKDRLKKEYCLGPTHEEVVTEMVANMGRFSHTRYPLMLYQITRKFRDEMHPKYSFLRGREFEMKDLYTFDKDEESAMQTYENVCNSYTRIFQRLGLNFEKVEGATGNIGGNLSHEFHLPANIGEDIFYTCEQCGFRSNSELIDDSKEKLPNLGCDKSDCNVTKRTGIEIGHAFYLGNKYSEVFNVQCEQESGGKSISLMGCYGIGVSRLLQAGVEVLSKERQIVWPSLIAPYQVCIIPQMQGYLSEEFMELSNDLSDKLTSLPNLKGEVVIDDRINKTVGKRQIVAREKGYPNVVIVNRKTVEEQQYEVIDMVTGTTDMMSLDQLMDKFSKIQTI